MRTNSFTSSCTLLWNVARTLSSSMPSLRTERTSLWLAGMVMAFRAALYTSPKSSRSISKTLPKLPSPMSRVMCQTPKMGSYCL